jgi:hypothetical protein
MKEEICKPILVIAEAVVKTKSAITLGTEEERRKKERCKPILVMT